MEQQDHDTAPAAAPEEDEAYRGPPPEAAASDTLVTRMILALSDLSLAAEEGQHLGSEDTLLATLGVSRPTLRQAAKVVESTRLISVRRGLRGGYYAARPSIADAVRAPARYLRLHDATLAQMHEISRVLGPESAALAAGCTDPALRAELAAFRAAIDAMSGTEETVAGMIESDRTLDMLIVRMTGNPVIALFKQVAYAFGELERDLRFYREAEDREHCRALQRSVCAALEAGDADVARLMVARRSALIGRWMTDERHHGPHADPAVSFDAPALD